MGYSVIVEQIEGVTIHPLKRIKNPLGDILHAIKLNDPGYKSFGEAYFSAIKFGARKGWKKHQQMTLNLIVPTGAVRFVIYDDRENSKTSGSFFKVELSEENYARLTVQPGLWMAFEGTGMNLNLVLNVASIPHDPGEALKRELDTISFNWE